LGLAKCNVSTLPSASVTSRSTMAPTRNRDLSNAMTRSAREPRRNDRARTLQRERAANDLVPRDVEVHVGDVRLELERRAIVRCRELVVTVERRSSVRLRQASDPRQRVAALLQIEQRLMRERTRDEVERDRDLTGPAQAGNRGCVVGHLETRRIDLILRSAQAGDTGRAGEAHDR